MRFTLLLLDDDHKVNRSVRDHAEKLFRKLERFLPDDASRVELRLEHIPSVRKDTTHYVHVAVAVPKEPHTLHAEVVAADFRTALDRLYGKTEKQLRRRHEKRIQRSRSSERKQRVNDWLHTTLSAPRRLLGRLRRRRAES